MDPQHPATTFIESDPTFRSSRLKLAKLSLIALGIASLGGFWSFLSIQSSIQDGVSLRSVGVAVLGLTLFLWGATGFCFWVIGVFLTSSLTVRSDRLLLIARRGRIVGEIPFSNVAQLKLNKYRQFRSIALFLHDPQHADTRWPTFEANGSIDLGEDLAVAPHVVLQAIMDRIETYRRGPEPGLSTRYSSSPMPVAVEPGPIERVWKDYQQQRDEVTEMDFHKPKRGTTWGPGLIIHCPLCKARSVQASSYTLKEMFVKTHWLRCSSCGQELGCRRPVTSLLGSTPEELAPLLFPHKPFVAKMLAVLAIVLCLFPTIGLMVSVGAAVANLRADRWRTLSWIALSLSVASHLLMAYLVYRG
jgi:hypothetical protein